jgi:hypothetical protein
MGHQAGFAESDDVPRNGNVWGMVHRAVRLIYYARLEGMRGASSWQMFSNLAGPGFGILSQQARDKRFAMYWLYYHFNRHLGDEVLATSGTAPFHAPAAGDDPRLRPGTHAAPLTPFLATRRKADGAIELILANGSSKQAVPASFTIQGQAIHAAEGLALTQPSLDSPPLLSRREDEEAPLAVTLEGNRVRCTLPPACAAFIRLR